MAGLKKGSRFLGQKKIPVNILLTRVNSLRSAAAGRLFARGVGNREINLLLERVDPRDEYPDFVANPISAVRSPANQAPLSDVEAIEIVSQRRDVNEPGYDGVR